MPCFGLLFYYFCLRCVHVLQKIFLLVIKYMELIKLELFCTNTLFVFENAFIIILIHWTIFIGTYYFMMQVDKGEWRQVEEIHAVPVQWNLRP